MEAYSVLAKYYDILMKDFDYNGYVKFISSYIKGETIDLCCGSGAMTVALAKMGAKVIGVDCSDQMLNQAKQKARKDGANITFICNDITKFQPMHSVDTVTCVCDGINYINPKNIKPLFSKIAGYLKTGGYFIFDISSEYKLTTVLSNNTFCEDTDLATYIWSNKLTKNKLHMSLSFFEEVEGGLYKRLEEEHDQFVQTKESIIEALDGLFDTKVYDGTDYKQCKEDSLRLLFVCRKV